MDKQHRFVMIETRNDVDDGTEKHLVRYQLHNHLGSTNLELDDNAEVISYEEFHPYGATAYQAKNTAIKAAAKRYRYTGMERDKKSGLEYHNVRYYLPWLGRWLSADPIGIGGAMNLFNYSFNNPVNFFDSSGNSPLSWLRETAVGFGHYSWGVAKGVTYPVRHPIKTIKGAIATVELVSEGVAMATIAVIGDDTQKKYVKKDLESKADAIRKGIDELATKDPNEILEGLGEIVGGIVFGAKTAPPALRSVRQFAKKGPIVKVPTIKRNIKVFIGQSPDVAESMRKGLKKLKPKHPGRAHYGEGVYTTLEKEIAGSYGSVVMEGIIDLKKFKVLNVKKGSGAEAFKIYLKETPKLKDAWKMQENRLPIFEEFVKSYAPKADIVIAPHGIGTQIILRSKKALHNIKLK
jgi:RHS repeat-associated protein